MSATSNHPSKQAPTAVLRLPDCSKNTIRCVPAAMVQRTEWDHPSRDLTYRCVGNDTCILHKAKHRISQIPREQISLLCRLTIATSLQGTLPFAQAGGSLQVSWAVVAEWLLADETTASRRHCHRLVKPRQHGTHSCMQSRFTSPSQADGPAMMRWLTFVCITC